MRTDGIRARLAGVVIALAAGAGEGGAQPPDRDAIGGLIDDRAAGAGPQAEPAYLDRLHRLSCPGVGRQAEAIEIRTSTVPLQGLNPGRKTVGQLTYVAGFQLSSNDPRFGGLSGLDFLDDGNLLAVSDAGAFVWIDLAEDGVTPVAARLSAMTDAGGAPFANKAAGDAEGLAMLGGLALVSFEGNPRVLAFDVGGCGAAARGAPVGWKMADAFARRKLKVDGNTGVEALAITPDGYLFAGIETKVDKASPLSARPLESAPRFDLTLGENAPEFVGLDLILAGKEGGDIRAFSLHRSTSPLAGNAITIVETDFEQYSDPANVSARATGLARERLRSRFRMTGSQTLAEMNMLLTIDNFEGIAARETPDGRVRLFIVSDDNFSTRQRTLLMVFDVAKQD